MKGTKLHTISLLVVDDDSDLLFILHSQLKKAGYRVYINSGGERLLEQIKLRKPDFVLLDLSMNMINGQELCRLIKKENRFAGTKVILMSGNHNIEAVAVECGADGFVAKPLSIPEVETALRKYS